jgi:gliding motility-associated-like protein
MLKRIAVAFLLFLSVFSLGQCNDCFKNYGGWVHESVSDIKKINSETSILINTQGGGYYPKIIKHDSNCNVIFQKTFSSEYLGLEKHIYDNQGNCYLLISYGFATITTAPGPYLVSGITLYRGLNLVKLNATGSPIWSKAISSFDTSTITNIFYYNNEIVITGQHVTDNTISGSNIYSLPDTNNEIRTYISKFDLNGTYINSIFIDIQQDAFFDSVIDLNGNIFMSKRNPFPPYSSSIIKVNNSMNLVWSKEISNNSNSQSTYFKPKKLYYNTTNNKLYLWSTFNETIDVLGNIFSTNTTNNSIFNSLLVEFNPINGDLNNIKNFDSKNDQNAYMAHSNNELYVFSSLRGSMTFSNTTISSSSYIDSNITIHIQDLILFKVNLTTFNSEFLFKSFNNTSYINSYSRDNPASILFHNNELFLTANFSSNPISFNNSSVNNNSGNQDFDVLFFKLSSNSILNPQSPPINLNNCLNSIINLSAPNGSNYSWTGPNGFTSNIQNPSISNANITHSGQYTCNLIGTNGCNVIQTINVFVGDNTKPIPTTNPLPQINGDCNTTISIPTASDNCSGLINATTTDQLTNLLPGTHTINWTYNDGNGNIENQNQTVNIIAVSLPTITSPQTFCIQQNATLNTIAITGQNIKWYDAPTNGNLLPNTTGLVNGTTYYASQTINSCESNRVPVTVQIQNTPAPTGNANQSFCSTANSTVADIVAAGTNIIWYNSATSTSPLANSTLLTNNTTYYATQTINGCESLNRLAVTINLINTLNANNYSETICDNLNDNVEIKNLTSYNSNLISSTGNIFNYYNSYNDALNQNGQIINFANYNLVLGTNTFYVRIDSPNTCFQIVTLTLELVSKPIIPINDMAPICEGSSITLNGGNNYDSYTWSTGETSQIITITQPGNYSVIVTENHGATTCTSTKNFTVANSNIATIQEIISSDWTDNNNTISVLLHNNSQGDYEYSLNGIDFQESNIFNNLEAGEYTVFVRDKNGCGMVSEELYLLMYPKFFTPNGDGYNDYWKIKFSENEPNLTIKIFDRYGKFLKQLGTNSIGWDGKYLSNDLPSSDYWFVVTRENGKEYKGHFSLKR